MMYDIMVYNPFTITYQILFSNVPNVETANELLEMYVSDVIPKDVFSQIKFYKDHDKALTVDFDAGGDFHIITHYIGRIVKKGDFFKLDDIDCEITDIKEYYRKSVDNV